MDDCFGGEVEREAGDHVGQAVQQVHDHAGILRIDAGDPPDGEEQRIGNPRIDAFSKEVGEFSRA